MRYLSACVLCVCVCFSLAEVGQVVRSSHGESRDREIDEATERGAQETDGAKNQQRPPESHQSGSEGTAEEGVPTVAGYVKDGSKLPSLSLSLLSLSPMCTQTTHTLIYSLVYMFSTLPLLPDHAR
jgi:hypothetical protein